MYNKYLNFKLSKKKDFIELCADEICILENKEEDIIFEYKKPNCLMEIINRKLSLFDLHKYYILTLKISSPNRITDYKRIWKLAGFETPGIYDGSYNCANERVYFGIYKDFLPYFNSTQINIVLLYLPDNFKFSFKEVIQVFEKNGFVSYHEEQNLIKTLACLQKSINHAIVVYEFPKQAKVYVFGQGVENEFSCKDLPIAEIIEK